MRIHATVAAVSGALALSALAVPAAHADDSVGDTKISNVVVNGGKSVVAGPTAAKKVTVTFTVTDNSGADWAQAILYHGPSVEKSDTGAIADSSDGEAKCTKVNATKSTCTSAFTLEPAYNLTNASAGTWKVWAVAVAKDDNFVQKDNVKSFKVQRAAKLTVNASPEPVKKGRTITVTGKLSRANWETGKYAGYTGQSVKLQFRKKSSSTYTTVKTVKTNSTGNLKTTVKASADGYYRFAFAGTSTTPAANAAGDYVDVR
ncbi:calcium-binding protein [Streptomyces pimonensis]|uniref:Calcium-binding protein n=1 Tax=Streptomyces pimonensis TaxID=2860288 RepID=A0ABV4IRD2_9ACTN